MKEQQRLKIAIQKRGRLKNSSINLLSKCDLKIKSSEKLFIFQEKNFPIDVLFVRDDDIPILVSNGACDLGIIGENVLLEEFSNNQNQLKTNFSIVKKLGFSQCRLSLAIPKNQSFNSPKSLQGCRIATSYPNLLSDYLLRNKINAGIVFISGSVEIAPQIGMADAIFDLVSSGETLKKNNLKEVETVMQSQAVLIKTKLSVNVEKMKLLNIFFDRIENALAAQESRMEKMLS